MTTVRRGSLALVRFVCHFAFHLPVDLLHDTELTQTLLPKAKALHLDRLADQPVKPSHL